jgi:hypothetical protein
MVPSFSINGYKTRSPDLRHSELCSIHVSSFFHDFMFCNLPVKTSYSYPCIQHTTLSPFNSPLTSDAPRCGHELLQAKTLPCSLPTRTSVWPRLNFFIDLSPISSLLQTGLYDTKEKKEKRIIKIDKKKEKPLSHR